jgi:hypothetical protein
MYRDPMNSAFDMYRMMATAAEACTRYAWADPAQARSAPADNAQRMSQLYFVFVNSGYRYLARWAEISAKRYPDFARTLAAINTRPSDCETDMAALMDSLRGFLREMGELPLEESRRLQAEIDAIMATATVPQDASTNDVPPPKSKRRARTKS